MQFKKQYSLFLASALVICSGALTLCSTPAEAKHLGAKQSAQLNPTAHSEDEQQVPTQDQESNESVSDQAANEGESTGTKYGGTESPQEVSLLNVVCNMGAFWFGAIALIFVLTVSNLIIPAMVWHIGKVLRGGKKPQVG